MRRLWYSSYAIFSRKENLIIFNIVGNSRKIKSKYNVMDHLGYLLCERNIGEDICLDSCSSSKQCDNLYVKYVNLKN